MNKKKITICYLIVIAVFFVCNASAYDDKITHPDLTNTASKQAAIERFLSSNLDMKFGLETQLTSNNEKRSIRKWVQQGSIEEDTPNCRASNHFHNPLLPWNKSFMSDDVTFLADKIREFCNVMGWPYLLRKSDITWATGYLAPTPDGQKANSILYWKFSLFKPDREDNREDLL